jgi:Protein of unknown function (DUF2752)
MSQTVEIRRQAPPTSLLRRRLLTAAGAALVLIGVAVLYSFPPTEHSFYPRCLFYMATGWHCPGCGATRCAYALVHGDVAQAAAYNLLLLFYLPYLMATAFNACWHAVVGRPAFRGRLPAWTIMATAILLVVYWVVRNLPFAPFTLLAPHQL